MSKILARLNGMNSIQALNAIACCADEEVVVISRDKKIDARSLLDLLNVVNEEPVTILCSENDCEAFVERLGKSSIVFCLETVGA